ncbi:MAG: hypothetical protein KC415_00785 [Anaerolineales bacterium]|nr:hypothetical protein [Anaerolineales bacterium]
MSKRTPNIFFGDSGFSILNWHFVSPLFLLVMLLLVVACAPTMNINNNSPAGTLQPLDENNSFKNPLIRATRTPLPTIQPKPDFVLEVSPPESMSIPYGIYRFQHPDIIAYGLVDLEDAWNYGYKSEICVDVDLGELVQPGDNLALDDDTRERFQLIVDGNIILVEGSRGYSGGVLVLDSLTDFETTWGTYTIFCWFAPLEPGTHEVTLKFQQTSGDIQAYSWQFALTNKLSPRMPPTLPTVQSTPVP